MVPWMQRFYIARISGLHAYVQVHKGDVDPAQGLDIQRYAVRVWCKANCHEPVKIESPPGLASLMK